MSVHDYDMDTESALEEAIKSADASAFQKYGSAKKSKSGMAINFIPSKEMKAQGAKAFTVAISMLKSLIDGKTQFIGLSAMSDQRSSAGVSSTEEA